MKWKNKGHEYDGLYEVICEKKRFYLFGAGDYGRQFYHIMKSEISICGYIDNNPEKQGKLLKGINCRSFADIIYKKDTGIILTMSQMARIEPVNQLEKAGYKRNIDYFIIEEFLSVYFVYKYDKVYFSSISLLPSTTCNLKCRNCLNFNPFAKNFYIREMKQVMDDIDLFFSCVDRIMLFHVSGGEPLLYKHIAELIQYIDDNYGDRIDTLRTVTNGTVVPDIKTLETLAKCGVEITVDDYREAVPWYKENFDCLIEKLEQFQINYYINKADYWIDLKPIDTDHSHWTSEQLQDHFDNCCQSWQELRDGKLYSCNYDAYATVAGINPIQDKEVYDLTKFSGEKKELVEFRLGYNEKGYTNLCRHCEGFVLSNDEKCLPADQIGGMRES